MQRRGWDPHEHTRHWRGWAGRALVAALGFAADVPVHVSHRVPRLWIEDAVCETGQRPPNWRFRAGEYEGGIAFYHGTWEAWRGHVRAAAPFEHAYDAPAWVQAKVAAWGLANLGTWGCLTHPSVARWR